MKTKLVIVATLATLALTGCSGSIVASKASAESPVYWTEIARQKVNDVSISPSLITLMDAKGNIIVLSGVNGGYSVTQIK